jgi:nucleoside phosphorylase
VVADDEANQTVVIVTALGVETQAVLRHLLGVTSETVSGTGFFRGQFEDWDVAVVEAGAGNASAAAITVRACDHYQPQVALFIGVAGGIKDVAIGDVVVATKVYGYESGKENEAGLRPRPSMLPSAHALDQRARILRQTEDWRARLNPNLAHEKPEVFVQPIAAGEKVVASTSAATALWLRDQYGDALAVEMEGRGFLEGIQITHPVQGCVVRGISDLLSGKADADRTGSQERAADAASAVAFQMLSGLVPQHRLSASNQGAPSSGEGEKIKLADLIALAQTLLTTGQPPSMVALFPDAPHAARVALEKSATTERTIVERGADAKDSLRLSIAQLRNREQRKHLILAPPGAGKTHALWQVGVELLAEEDPIPLYLPAGGLERWDDLVAIIRDATPNLPLDELLRDPRVCFLIDGWSEFAPGQSAGERQIALRALRDARVIANGKHSDVGDTQFKIWALELLSPQQVGDTLYAARLEAPLPSPQVVDLLRLPLLLSIHVLSGLDATAPGELLRQLHDHLARNFPEGFTTALAQAAADSISYADRSYGRLIQNLQSRAASLGVAEPIKHLRRLGTIVERNGQILPIHDLYWSWLIGLGSLTKPINRAAVDSLATREAFRLALQSGAKPHANDIASTVEDDLVLAGMLDAFDRPPTPAFGDSVTNALADRRLAVRCRGGLAALESGRAGLLSRTLQILTEVTAANLYLPAWPEALRPQVLFPQRAILGEWLGSAGTEFVLDAIAERGGPEWAPWLAQMLATGKIAGAEALAAALGCAGEVPDWGWDHLDDLLKSKPWKLRAAANRRSNLALARHIASYYDRLVSTVAKPGSSAWIDLNRVLVACGDDALFETLLGQFDSLSDQGQELLGYAVVERGQPWVATFQKIAFAKPGGHQHHRLAEVASPGIDDATARSWINAGYYEVGWRVLIARHGDAVLPELISELPASFADLHDIPSLAVMRFLDQAPESLTQELFGRLGSPMQPKAMQDVLNAIARTYPTGVPSIVQFVSQRPDALPAYHVRQTLRLYADWRKKSGAQLLVMLPSGASLPFERWIADISARSRWEDHFTPEMLASSPDLAISFVLGEFRNDPRRAAAVLTALSGVKSFSKPLFDHMLASPALAKLIPSVFAGAFDTFPAADLQQCLDAPEIDQDVLFFRLGASSNPLHGSVHAALIGRILAEPIDLHKARYVANMLRGHTDEDVRSILAKVPSVGGGGWLWLVREVEVARGQRLITESGAFR